MIVTMIFLIVKRIEYFKYCYFEQVFIWFWTYLREFRSWVSSILLVTSIVQYLLFIIIIVNIYSLYNMHCQLLQCLTCLEGFGMQATLMVVKNSLFFGIRRCLFCEIYLPFSLTLKGLLLVNWTIYSFF